MECSRKLADLRKKCFAYLSDRFFYYKKNSKNFLLKHSGCAIKQFVLHSHTQGVTLFHLPGRLLRLLVAHHLWQVGQGQLGGLGAGLYEAQGLVTLSRYIC